MAKDDKADILVKDKTADLYLKVIGWIATITIALIGVIGGFIIKGQEITNVELKNINNKMGIYNAELQTHASRISRNEKDIKEISDTVFSNSDRIYQLGVQK